MRAREKPRRVARLIGSIIGVLAGVLYIVFPTVSSVGLFSASWPARAWGVFFLIGGAISCWSWFSRILILDRIGLSFLVTGAAALLFTQTLIMLEAPITLTRGGGTAVLGLLLACLISRWQDVRHEEREAQRAMLATDVHRVVR